MQIWLMTFKINIIKFVSSMGNNVYKIDKDDSSMLLHIFLWIHNFVFFFLQLLKDDKKNIFRWADILIMLLIKWHTLLFSLDNLPDNLTEMRGSSLGI